MKNESLNHIIMMMEGGGDDMLQRVKELENKVATLVTDIAIIKDKLASKEDIQSVNRAT
jgi:uncharacterized small protein (DUF1192 family)